MPAHLKAYVAILFLNLVAFAFLRGTITPDLFSNEDFKRRRNLWLLMLYASDLFRTRGIGKIGLEDSPNDLPDLVAEILAHAVEVRQRRRLSLEYRSRDAVINRVRGRIDVLATERHQLMDRGLVACRFDELVQGFARIVHASPVTSIPCAPRCRA